MKKARWLIIALCFMMVLSFFTTASAASKKKVTVKPKSVTVSPIGPNNKATFTANSSNIEWTVLSGGEFVDIEPNGKKCTVTGKELGRAVVRATNRSTGKGTNVVVNVRITPVKSVSLSKALTIDQRKDSYQMGAMALPGSATYRDITWIVEDLPGSGQPSQFATIEPYTGLLKIKKDVEILDGTKVYVTAMSHQGDGQIVRSARCAITFKNIYPAKLSLNKKKITLSDKLDNPSYYKLIPITKPALNTLGDSNVTWTSSNTDIITVNDGMLATTGKRDGTCTVTATVNAANGKVLTAKCTVVVNGTRVSKFTLSSKNVLNLEPGETSKVSTAISPATATYKNIYWVSNNPEVAEVDNSGLITTKKKGYATITATTDNGRKAVSVKVNVRKLSEMKQINMTFAGDAVLGGDPREGKKLNSRARFQSFVAKGYDYFFKDLIKVFGKDDMTLLNLECTLGTGGSSKSKKYIFTAPASNAQILTAGSVEMVGIVNNHIRDAGSGPHKTKAALNQYGVKYADSGTNFGNYTVDGVRIGVVAIQTPVSGGKIASLVRQCKAKHDIVIVFFHFCDVKEYKHGVRGSQVSQSHAAINAGADYVIGCHPHVVSGAEFYNNKYIFYDLGSLISPGANFRHQSMIVGQTFYYDPDIDYVELGKPRIYPVATCKQVMEGGNNDCQPVFIPKSNGNWNKVVGFVVNNSKGLKAEDFEWIDGTTLS